ncbi:Bfr2p [Saccharomyces cerevisiae x Saccharomyces kudriavzevii VIN7]|uniref:Protein BFR2 n=1 Tax=Saccharomyces cerevisiae x Saccharomyces kudriavzevii (strain VIN7) TaxID=1095631 RepID=H0GT40_SACCK|nr:Bfr2p [Saccharomyces cerevisiae x Saccharomyces kudriavzevii VIN7]
MGKLLADQISDIAIKPVNEDFDIEDEENASLFQLNEKGGDSDFSDNEDVNTEQAKKSHYLEVEKSKLRAEKGLELNDSKYTGVKGSRQALYNEFSDDEEDENEKSQEEENNDGEDDDALSFRTDSDDEQAEDEEKSDSDGDEMEEAQQKRNALSKLVQQETKQAINKLSQSVQKDASKGYSILQQTKLFDNIIDLRIKLQKAVIAANRLPLTTESWKEARMDNSRETKHLLRENEKLFNKLFNQLINFRIKFQIGDHIAQSEEKAKHKISNKRSVKELYKETDTLDSELKEYRNAVLNKWSTKVSSASGNSALSSNKFKAINLSADVQVENQLSDMSRLMKRTKLNRRNIAPLYFQKDWASGKLPELASSNAKEEEEEDIDDNLLDDGLDIPKNYDPRRKDNNAIDTIENPYVFDDEDFYRVLLNDLIDKKISNAHNSESAAITITSAGSRSNNKLKKNIDTKASKGRKLNYSIQDPIANYEAPIISGYKWSDDQIDEFFAGLLGQRVNFNENEDEHQHAGEEDNGDFEAVKNDDIQIFG